MVTTIQKSPKSPKTVRPRTELQGLYEDLKDRAVVLHAMEESEASDDGGVSWSQIKHTYV